MVEGYRPYAQLPEEMEGQGYRGQLLLLSRTIERAYSGSVQLPLMNIHTFNNSFFLAELFYKSTPFPSFFDYFRQCIHRNSSSFYQKAHSQEQNAFVRVNHYKSIIFPSDLPLLPSFSKNNGIIFHLLLISPRVGPLLDAGRRARAS